MPDDLQQEMELSRRELLRRGAVGIALLGGASALLGGCASSGSRAGLPGPRWPGDTGVARAPGSRQPWEPLPDTTPRTSLPSGVIPRSTWAKGSPVPSLMNRADRRFDRITLHHDGMTVFTTTDYGEAARRIENIRSAHRGRDFGDVGYHYLIDPAGRIWEGRSLVWQGAHVKDQNPGNLGICLMGNYEIQSPTPRQLDAVEHFVAQQMNSHRVPVGRVFTHKELAPTACPGRSLQPRLVSMRRGGTLSRTA